MSDEVFGVYSRNHEVRNTNTEVEEIYIDESHPLWVKERVRIEAGYNSEKMDILIFRPKNSFGPSDAVIFCV